MKNHDGNNFSEKFFTKAYLFVRCLKVIQKTENRNSNLCSVLSLENGYYHLQKSDCRPKILQRY